MTETIKELLTWLVPSGGLGAVIVWLTNKTLRKIRTSKEVHDTYKLMYEDVQKTIKELRDENKQLHKAMSRLERILSKVYSCRHYDTCPVRSELREQKKHDAITRADRQPSSARGARDDISPDPGVEGQIGGSSDEPP